MILTKKDLMGKKGMMVWPVDAFQTSNFRSFMLKQPSTQVREAKKTRTRSLALIFTCRMQTFCAKAIVHASALILSGLMTFAISKAYMVCPWKQDQVPSLISPVCPSKWQQVNFPLSTHLALFTLERNPLLGKQYSFFGGLKSKELPVIAVSSGGLLAEMKKQGPFIKTCRRGNLLQ